MHTYKPSTRRRINRPFERTIPDDTIQQQQLGVLDHRPVEYELDMTVRAEIQHTQGRWQVHSPGRATVWCWHGGDNTPALDNYGRSP